MVQVRYTAKALRDAGLAAVMGGLAVTNSLENKAITAAAVICAAGAGICVLVRLPMILAELNGYRTGLGSLTSSVRGVRA